MLINISSTIFLSSFHNYTLMFILSSRSRVSRVPLGTLVKRESKCSLNLSICSCTTSLSFDLLYQSGFPLGVDPVLSFVFIRQTFFVLDLYAAMISIVSSFCSLCTFCCSLSTASCLLNSTRALDLPWLALQRLSFKDLNTERIVTSSKTSKKRYSGNTLYAKSQDLLFNFNSSKHLYISSSNTKSTIAFASIV